MLRATATIDKDQRDGLYELVRNHLGGIEDLWIALERTQDFDTAETLGGEFAEDFRLLSDIGWWPDDEREEFELTLSTGELAELLERLHGDARRLFALSPSERRAIEDDEETNRRFERGMDACEEVRACLDLGGGA